MWVRAFHWTVFIVVLVVAVTGLFISGSPSKERARRLDEQRVSHLESISYGIDQYWNTNSRLPQSLEELSTSRNIFIQAINDPGTGELYTYERTGTDTYQLCASFETVTPNDERTQPVRGTRFWAHGVGETCFGLEVIKTTEEKPAIVR